MLYLNQLDYADMPYPTNLDEPESDYAANGTVAKAGCGLCSLCMVVDRLTLSTLSLEECRDLSVSSGANREPGTDMKILGWVVAKKFGLRFRVTADPSALAACLRAGGAAIVNVGGDREGHVGTFSSIGHYVVAVSESGGEFALLDPSWRADKYAEEPRRSRVRESGGLLYATAEVLERDAAGRAPGFYLFNRLSDK